MGLDASSSDNLTGLTDGVFDRAVSYFDHASLHKNSKSSSDNDDHVGSGSGSGNISLDEQQKFDMLVHTAIREGDEKKEGSSFFIP